MTEEIRELDCVALINDLPDAGLAKGHTGAVVLVHNAGEAFEVEFPVSARIQGDNGAAQRPFEAERPDYSIAAG
jgi:hypothetical protein